MKIKTKFYLTTAFAMMLILVAQSYSQTSSITPQKLALIEEMRALTGLAKFSVNQKVNESDIDQIVVRKVKGLTDVTDAQRGQLNDYAVEAGKRLKKLESDYFNDKEVSAQMMKMVTINLIDKAFTEEELKEIVEFYRKPVGKKVFDFDLRLVERITKDYALANKRDFEERLQKEMVKEFDLLQKKIDEVKATPPVKD